MITVRVFTIVVLSCAIASWFFISSGTEKSQPNPFRRKHLLERVCPDTGPDSAAPINFESLSIAIRDAVQRIQSENKDAVIISTTVNKEAAEQNLPVFIKSLSYVQPPLLSQTLVFCLDEWALRTCSNLHSNPMNCLYMDLKVSTKSLAPSTASLKDYNVRSYWRVTFGRVYATLKIHNEGVSVLPVDVDAVFLKNPFLKSEDILRFPESIAAVVDSKFFDLSATDANLLINGGFLYFPARNPKTAILTNNFLRDLWKKSCSSQNEQVEVTRLLKELHKSLPRKSKHRPRILNPDKFLNFCSTNCGTDKFSGITSLTDLKNLEIEMKNNSNFRACTPNVRKDWVFFHAACTVWPKGQFENLAKNKGAVQEAILAWVQESRGELMP